MEIMATTGIEWTDQVWNPIRGCSAVSEGCRNCYAQRFAGRFARKGQPYEGLVKWTKKGPIWNGEVHLIPEKLHEPYSWGKPRRVFVNSMSDLFHEEVPDDYIRDVFAVMAECSKHTFQILTKRAGRMEQWFNDWSAGDLMEFCEDIGVEWPIPNVWLGVSCEDQATAEDRVHHLLSAPAVVRFVSAEPLISSLDLANLPCPVGRGTATCGMCMGPNGEVCCKDGYFNALEEGIDWVIVGCETGPKLRRREMEEGWVRELRWQCRMSDTAFFYKQAMDEKGNKVTLPLLDGQRWNEYPNEQR
jgi:protein gp37